MTAITNISLRGMLSGAAPAFTPSDVFSGANDEWWRSTVDTEMTFVAADTVDQYSISSEVATVQTTAAHNKLVGDNVVVADVAAAVNGTFTVASVPSSTTLTYSVPGAGDIGNTAAAGTMDWEDKKVSAHAGVNGNWSRTQAAVSRMPQWDESEKALRGHNTRQYYMDYPDGLRDAMSGQVIGLWTTFLGASNKIMIGTSTGDRYNVYINNSGGGLAAVSLNGTVALLSSSSASYINGNRKVEFVNTTASVGEMFVNDTVTPVDSDASDTRPTFTTETLQFMTFGGFFGNGTDQLYSYTGIKIGGDIDATNRANLKAYGEAEEGAYG